MHLYVKVPFLFLQFGGMAMPGMPAQGMAMPGIPAQGMAMPGIPAQGMAMPGVPAAGGYPGQQYGGYPGAFPAPPTQDPMWGYFTAVAGQVRAACVNVDKMYFRSSHVVHVVFVDCFIRMVKLMLKNFKGASPSLESVAPILVSTERVEIEIAVPNK